MLTQLQAWNGAIEYDGELFDSFEAFSNRFKATGEPMRIKLYPKGYKQQVQVGNNEKQQVEAVGGQYKIFVKQYMTKKAEPQFDFMVKWNNDNPMPYRLMIGEKVKETRGMVYMKLHADITEERASFCMCCGKKLTNPVSQYFGIGPECGNHNYVNPFASDQELRDAVADYRKQLRTVVWEGWIIKSAIISEEVI